MIFVLIQLEEVQILSRNVKIFPVAVRKTFDELEWSYMFESRKASFLFSPKFEEDDLPRMVKI